MELICRHMRYHRYKDPLKPFHKPGKKQPYQKRVDSLYHISVKNTERQRAPEHGRPGPHHLAESLVHQPPHHQLFHSRGQKTGADDLQPDTSCIQRFTDLLIVLRPHGQRHQADQLVAEQCQRSASQHRPQKSSLCQREPLVSPAHGFFLLYIPVIQPSKQRDRTCRRKDDDDHGPLQKTLRNLYLQISRSQALFPD